MTLQYFALRSAGFNVTPFGTGWSGSNGKLQSMNSIREIDKYQLVRKGPHLLRFGIGFKSIEDDAERKIEAYGQSIRDYDLSYPMPSNSKKIFDVAN
jgi:hypothetical protein